MRDILNETVGPGSPRGGRGVPDAQGHGPEDGGE